MPKKKQNRRSKARARASTSHASTATTDPTLGAEPTPPGWPTAHAGPPRRDRPRVAIAVSALIALAALVALAVAWSGDDAQVASDEVATGSIVVGTPGGFVLQTSSPEPTAAEPTATPSATASATPVVTPIPAPVALAPTPAATPAPTPPPAAAPTPPPTPVLAAVAGPADTVTAFYAAVAAGEFDRAYALWSDRMKADYPRAENLDQRFAETASIQFTELYVASQTATTATVQANFVETYDSGGTRQFIGYWDLVLVDGRWLLDHPSY